MTGPGSREQMYAPAQQTASQECDTLVEYARENLQEDCADREWAATCRGCIFETLPGQHIRELLEFQHRRSRSPLLPEVCRLLLGPRLQDLAAVLLGCKNCFLFNDQYIVKPSRSRLSAFAWHCDSAWCGGSEVEYHPYLSIWVALDDIHAGNGALLVRPSSGGDDVLLEVDAGTAFSSAPIRWKASRALVSLAVPVGGSAGGSWAINDADETTYEYDSSPVLVMCETCSKVSAQLQDVSDSFEDGGTLQTVLELVCHALELDAGWLQSGANEEACQRMSRDDSEAGSEAECASQRSSDAGDDCWDMAENDNEALTKVVMQKLSRWERAEEARERAEEEAQGTEASADARANTLPNAASARVSSLPHAVPAGAALSMEEKLASKRQIFAPREAFKMLSRELSDLLMAHGNGVDFAADAVGDNVFHWQLTFDRLTPGCLLAQDIAEMERRHGQCGVRLRLRFKRGLHPFYPPSVELLQPRFCGPLLGALASHPLLQITHWDPWRPLREVALQLRAYVEAVGRVDLGSPLNDPELHPECAYTPMERLLARLEALTLVAPTCQAQHAAMYNVRQHGADAVHLQALTPCSKRAKTAGDGPAEAKDKRAWAAGTGYGSGYRTSKGEVWDARQGEAMQAAHDAELRRVLLRLTATLGRHVGGAGGAAAAAAAGSELSAEASAGPAADAEWGSDCDLSGSGSAPGPSGAAEAADPEGAAVAAVSESCLVPFLERQLVGASFTDMASRVGFYMALLGVTRCACDARTAHLLFRSPTCTAGAAEPGSAPEPLAVIFGRLQARAAQFLHVVSSVAAAAPAPAAARSGARAAAAAALSATVGGRGAGPGTAAAAEDTAAEETRSRALAQLIIDIAGAMKELEPAAEPEPEPERRVTRSTRAQGWAAAAAAAAARDGGAVPDPASAAVPDDPVAAAEMYRRVMRPLLVDMVAGMCDHQYERSLATEGVHSRLRMVKVGKELAGLAADLPLDARSSVFVRVSEEQVVLWKALITGPEGTPYSGGCFLFDIYFPTQYPNSPPNVILRTTGGGSVRFNPNLYNCGKVCLSLLGTWSGGRGEGWDAHSSSALQVLVSIQSLILVDQPYFNEPGYEGSMHTDAGRAASHAYNLNIREQTMHWAVWQMLKSPPKGFEEVVRAHFRLRRAPVLAACEAWVADAPAASQPRMRTFLNNIRGELGKL
ncbi:hypothetical protein WJX81_002568 [Elliptochloris bilobata]|uniref:UBC core domain-containing protein n=1 Tax=Elliptochloris bilobata TaxID=381761 RepID=A0AAW1RAM9_9CHLO